MKFSVVALLTAALPVAAPLAAQTAEAALSLDKGTISLIKGVIVQFQKDSKIPGLSVAIGVDNQVAWAKGFGLADIENQTKATAQTSYRHASISKVFTAVLAMQLATDKQLDLDADVRNYVPTFPKKRWPVTCRQLLSHLGGVRHYRGQDEINSARLYPSVRSALKIFADDPLLSRPGTRYTYTSYGYNLLGAAVAAAGRKRFDRLLKEKILDPCEMTATGVDSSREIIPHRAQGYILFGGKLQNSAPVDTSNKIPSGGLRGTAPDLVRFGNALLADKLLPRAVLDQMWTPTPLPDGKTISYGLGFQVSRAARPRQVGHGGAQPRVSTHFLILPEQGIVIAVMCNLQRVRPGKLASSIAMLVAGWKAAKSLEKAAPNPKRRR